MWQSKLEIMHKRKSTIAEWSLCIVSLTIAKQLRVLPFWMELCCSLTDQKRRETRQKWECHTIDSKLWSSCTEGGECISHRHNSDEGGEEEHSLRFTCSLALADRREIMVNGESGREVRAHVEYWAAMIHSSRGCGGVFHHHRIGITRVDWGRYAEGKSINTHVVPRLIYPFRPRDQSTFPWSYVQIGIYFHHFRA